jgi:hypothetical protein
VSCARAATAINAKIVAARNSLSREDCDLSKGVSFHRCVDLRGTDFKDYR